MCNRKKSVVFQMQQKIETLVESYDAKLLYFQYYKKTFGNIVIEIEKEKDIFTFILDRSDIICNGKSSIDGLTRTIKCIPREQYQENAYIQLLEFINEILRKNLEK